MKAAIKAPPSKRCWLCLLGLQMLIWLTPGWVRVGGQDKKKFWAIIPGTCTKNIPSEGMTLPTARNILQGMRGLEDTMDTYGPARAGRYVSFLRLFPNLFKVTGSGPGLRVMKADPPPPREPRPAAASSSTARAPRIELGPRAVYRRFFNEIPVVYSAETLPGETARDLTLREIQEFQHIRRS